jgi:hypothetical protein
MAEKGKYPFRIYFWMLPNEVTGKLRKSRWRMTEQDAARYPGAVKIEADSMLIERPSESPGTPTNWYGK